MEMHKAVFLDKDGTMIEDVPYNIDPNKIKLTEGCAEGLHLLQAQGFKLIVISNQSGIAKGFFQPADLQKAESYLANMLSGSDVHLDGFYYCPHHPEGIVQEYRMHCSCRKPGAGLIEKAVCDHNIDPVKSWMIGDILNDIEAGRKAGCRTILIDNGNETEWILSPHREPHYRAATIREAAEVISRMST